MADEDSIHVAFEKQDLDDTISCCICTNVYTDPKALPCIHTFCLKCLQKVGLTTNKGPGDEMPCPICRRQFNVPSEGFSGLPNNFFLAKLIQSANVPNPSDSSSDVCDVCLEDNEEAGKEIPKANMYCTDCKQKLCEECCRQHRKFKLNKNHKLMSINEQQESSDNVKMTDLEPTVCELHEQKCLDIYCIECKTVQCAVCFIDGHKHHDGSHVSKFVDGFRKQIESNIDTINQCNSKILEKKAELLEAKEDMQQNVETLELDVMKRRDELKQFADTQANSLLQSLSSLRQSKLKEIQIEADDIDAHLSCLQSHSSLCQKMTAKGSASDICRAASDLSFKATELQEQCHSLIEREIQSFKFCFTKSELEELIEDDNLIGEIDEECNKKQWKTSRTTSKVALMKKQSSEIHVLKEDIKLERTEKETSQLENEQLKISVNNEKETSGILKEELNKNVASYSAKISQLKLELDNEKVTNKKLVQNLKHLKKTVQVDVNKLKQDFEDERTTVAKLEQELDKEKTKSRTLQDDNKKLNQELEAHKNAMQDFLKRKEQSNQDWENTKTGETCYKSDPVLVQTIITKAAEEKKKEIRGLTILDKELFVVSERSSEVEIYDSIKLSFSRRWSLKELFRPIDMGSCNRIKCLYIIDYKDFVQTQEILRVDPKGKVIKNWSTGNDYIASLSVTDESNVILAVHKKNILKEYSPDGQLIRVINISSDIGFGYTLHAIKLASGQFVVSHGSYHDDLFRVCVVDADGKLWKSFGGKPGSAIGQLDVPVYLAVVTSGFVMVADRNNGRVLLLDSDLEFKREILSKDKHGLQNPGRILLDESDDRLFVSNNESNNPRILIFSFK